MRSSHPTDRRIDANEDALLSHLRRMPTVVLSTDADTLLEVRASHHPSIQMAWAGARSIVPASREIAGASTDPVTPPFSARSVAPRATPSHPELPPDYNIGSSPQPPAVLTCTFLLDPVCTYRTQILPAAGYNPLFIMDVLSHPFTPLLTTTRLMRPPNAQGEMELVGEFEMGVMAGQATVSMYAFTHNLSRVLSMYDTPQSARNESKTVWDFKAPGMPHHGLLWKRKGDVAQCYPALALPTHTVPPGTPVLAIFMQPTTGNAKTRQSITLELSPEALADVSLLEHIVFSVIVGARYRATVAVVGFMKGI